MTNTFDYDKFINPHGTYDMFQKRNTSMREAMIYTAQSGTMISIGMTLLSFYLSEKYN